MQGWGESLAALGIKIRAGNPIKELEFKTSVLVSKDKTTMRRGKYDQGAGFEHYQTSARGRISMITFYFIITYHKRFSSECHF